MRLVPARPRDAARLGRIMGDWAEATPWMPRIHTAAEDRNFMRRMIDRFEVTVARNWRGAQGFLVRGGETVHALYLAPGARGRGVGRHLLDVAKAGSDRLELWCFAANRDARRFYAREGFAEVERTDGAGNDEKLPDVRLVWHRAEGAR